MRAYTPVGRYLYAIGAFGASGTRTALAGVLLAANIGSEAAFERIRSDRYQTITVADPLTLQGWQLVDELNRAIQCESCSGYVTSPALVTKEGQEKMDDSNAFDPDIPYREGCAKIWGKQVRDPTAPEERPGGLLPKRISYRCSE